MPDFYPFTPAMSETTVNELNAAANSGDTSGTMLLSGGKVAWRSGLICRVSAATYLIQGVQYSSAEDTITLATADASNPRLDVIGVDTSGAGVKVTGTAAAEPLKPA